MDRQNLRAVRALVRAGGAAAPHRAPHRPLPPVRVKEVPDPYYGGEEGFDQVLDLLEDACAGLLEALRHRVS